MPRHRIHFCHDMVSTSKRWKQMPFTEVSKMESRRKLVYDVLEGGRSLSAACIEAGVTRKTGRKWVERAKVVGIDEIAELSRSPKTPRTRIDPAIEAALVELKSCYGDWGAKKLVDRLRIERKMKVSLRTADRILERRGLTTPRQPKEAEPIRFERETCGALLQMDFKGLPNSTPYAILTVLDDQSRFCCHFAPVPDKSGLSVSSALWNVFGEHGLPTEMLMDNGDCWGARSSHAPTRFEAWLMRLGIKPIHGRPYHPQTQGKVERFHGTAKLELKQRLYQLDIESTRRDCKAFVDRYNWIRPHEGIGMQVPGSRYTRWSRMRPPTPPAHHIPEGAISRSVYEGGDFSYLGTTYHLGRGLEGERIVLQEDAFGMRIFYAQFPLVYLHEILTPKGGQPRT